MNGDRPDHADRFVTWLRTIELYGSRTARCRKRYRSGFSRFNRLRDLFSAYIVDGKVVHHDALVFEFDRDLLARADGERVGRELHLCFGDRYRISGI